MKIKLVITAAVAFGVGWFVGGQTVGEHARKTYMEELEYLKAKVLDLQRRAKKDEEEFAAEVAERIAKIEEEYQRKLEENVTEKASQALTDYQAGILRPVEPGFPKPTPLPAQRIEREYITPEEYVASETKYDQIELVYYAGDGVVLVAKTDRVLDDKQAELALGTFHTAFAAQGKDSIYVRNHTMRTEFEVNRVEESYEVADA